MAYGEADRRQVWFEYRVLGVQSEKGKEVAGIRQDRAWPSKTPLTRLGNGGSHIAS